MKKWENANISLGGLKEKRSVAFSFKAIADVDIKSIKVSCENCTKIISFDNSRINVLYTASRIPRHLQYQGLRELSFTKSIRVTYTDGSKEFLYFKGKIYK